ncbi:hypothetical protein GYMLUDRAFT_35913, partial [Collybiopsis luxurians FD-317 M1]
CRECSTTVPDLLPFAGSFEHKLFPNGHCVLPDMNVFLAQVQEVRHRSLPLYNRLQALTKSEGKLETAIICEEGETPNDCNDRGIRTTTAWYISLTRPPVHGKTQAPHPTVVLLTDDAANRQKAEQSVITSISVRKYVESMKEANQLLDLLSADGTSETEPTKAAAGRQVLYPDYLSTSTLIAGVKASKLHQGHFSANQCNYLEDLKSHFFSWAVNRAVQGDIVVVEAFPEKDCKAPADEVVDQEATLKNDDAEDSDEENDENGKQVLVKESRALSGNSGQKPLSERQQTGRVVGIIKRNWRAYVCHIDSMSLTSTLTTSLSTQTVFATPKILITIDRWNSTSRYPEGHFVRTLGRVESKEAEQESLLLEFEVPYRPFGKAILDCLPPKESSCQDIDDALHAKILPNGNIEAGVRYCNRIDMLPSLLGTNMCSLRPFIERLAFSSIWELTLDADIGFNDRLCNIKSKAAFMYEEAQIRRDDPNLQDELTTSIRLLDSLAIKLKAKRMAADALNLASPEVKIHLDSADPSDLVDVEQMELRETNNLVEEFMLLANISVARKIEDSFPQTVVLRLHLPPPKTDFEKLQDILQKTKRMTLDVTSLDKCIDPTEPVFNTLVRIIATRCMLSAEYFSSGSVAKNTFGHYGLTREIYMHFTSPIRQYADVLVHLQLASAIGFTCLHATLHSKSHVERILDVVNRRHPMPVEFYVSLALKSRGDVAKSRGEGEVREQAFVIRKYVQK